MKALLNIPHPEAIHSIRIMLESLGYSVEREVNRDTQIVVEKLLYEPYDIPRDTGGTPDLYVAVKPEVLKNEGKELLFLINGGDHGKNDFGVPTVTSNFHFKKAFRTYVPWFNRMGFQPREKLDKYEKPIGLLHGGYGWGFARYFPALKDDVDVYGWRSPAGLLPQFGVKEKLSKALCYVHLKSNDAPGYSLYESFASAVPIVVSQFFINNTQFQDLFIDGETCLVFGKEETYWHDKGATEEPKEIYDKVVKEIRDCIKRLSDPEENYRIGINGLFKWKELTRWTSKKRDDLKSYLSYNKLL